MPDRSSHVWKRSILALLLIGLTGCEHSDAPELGRVTGIVTYQGNPLPGAAITFQPENGRPSTARTDRDGKYQLIYIRNKPGAKVGPHRVEIRSLSEEQDQEHVGEGEEITRREKRKIREIIPEKYNRKSELQVEVKKGNNTLNFDLQ